MPWRDLRSFRDPSVPKLHNLRLAARAGLRVPATVWLPAREAHGAERPPLSPGAVIARSGSPTEDTDTTSNAGQLHSEVVPPGGDFAAVLARVVDALPRDTSGTPLGAVFVQPLVAAAEAGVAVFDGFFFERTLTAGGNEALTSGAARGDVVRGTLARDDAWSAWLARVGDVFLASSPSGAIDVEVARDARGYVLLQVRPALFPVRRNETLSLANHREILGDPPSPWITSAVVAAGRTAPEFFAEVFPEMREWNMPYAHELGGRAWLDFSLFHRLMDRAGLPRTMVNEGVGGDDGGPADSRVLLTRFVRSLPRLLHLQAHSLREVLRAPAGLAAFGRAVEGATTLRELHDATTAGLHLALRTNYGLGGMLSGAQKVRRFLRIGGRARVVTEEMMAGYQRLATLPVAEREVALDTWLVRFGHRGPVESDPARPRFAEMRDMLLADLAHAAASGAAPATSPPPLLLRPFYWVDERREWFRDELMRHWQVLRRRMLAEAERLVAAGRLDAVEDVFLLHGDDIVDESTEWASAARRRREHIEEIRHIDLPLTATRDEIVAVLRDGAPAGDTDARTFPGIALGAHVQEGRVVRADDLTDLLGRIATGTVVLGPDTILVVRALEPSWAVVFPRVGGVVAEIGGELSHAAILLREARRPAIVNCKGICAVVRDGDRVRLDGPRERVDLVERSPADALG